MGGDEGGELGRRARVPRRQHGQDGDAVGARARRQVDAQRGHTAVAELVEQRAAGGAGGAGDEDAHHRIPPNAGRRTASNPSARRRRPCAPRNVDIAASEAADMYGLSDWSWWIATAAAFAGT